MTVSISSRYRVIRRLGSGGMGEVFLAEDRQLQRRVALKLMSATLAADANERKRFRTEARIASGLSHPNVCIIYEVGEAEDGRPFLAMEYIEGLTLEQLPQQRRLRFDEVLQIGMEAAQALEAAHELKLVHRDVKPSNLMLDGRGHVKVLDFGVAKRVAQEELGMAASSSAAQTRTGILIGTALYMSPEQALGRAVDHRTDIFSLGTVLYELASGRRPFGGRTMGEVINSVINQPPGPLGLADPKCSLALEQILFKCLEKDPARRYPTAAALARDLAELKAQSEHEAKELKCSPAAEKSMAPAQVSRRAIVLAGAVVIVLIVVASVLLWPGQPKGGTALSGAATQGPPQKSVAVLPFDNFSADRETDYLSDGLTEEITTALSKLPGLKVVSRNSSFMFKGKREDLRQVGQALRAGTLLEGSIRIVGNRIRVSAQLINAADGYHLWSETYDRSVNDIIAVQEEIARRIAERLQGESAPIKQQAVSAEAHKLYLQGRLFWNKRTEAGIKRAIDLFQQALEKEPTYANAHAALASSYLLLPQYGELLRMSQYKPLARSAAEHALALEAGCAEAHAVLGMLEKAHNNFKAADEHFLSAIASEPNNATAHHWYGLCLECFGRRQQGLLELQKALELDPLSPIIHATIPEWYYLDRQYDRAIAEARKEIETFPEFAPMRNTLIAALVQQKKYAEALTEIDQARALVPDQKLFLVHVQGYCLARIGREAEARQLLAELEQQRQKGKYTEGLMLMIYQGLREYDREFELGNQILQAEGELEPEILYEPALDEIRDLPQFQALLQRAGLTNTPAP